MRISSVVYIYIYISPLVSAVVSSIFENGTVNASGNGTYFPTAANSSQRAISPWMPPRCIAIINWTKQTWIDTLPHTHTHWWRRKCCVHGDAERTLSSWFHSVWNWYWCLTIWQMLLRLFCNRDEDLKRKYTLNTRQFQSVSRANTLMVGWIRYFFYFFVFFLRSIYICGPWVSKTTATYVAKID